MERYVGRTEGLRTAWWQTWPVPVYSHRFAILSWLSPALLPMPFRQDWFQKADDTGWVTAPQVPPTPERQAAALAHAQREYADYFQAFQLGGINPAALRELLELCREEKITAALLLMPEGRAFQSWYPPAVWVQVEKFLAELHQQYRVPIIRARDWVPDDEFGDSHHLMPEGADRFSSRLGREAVAPLLSSR